MKKLTNQKVIVIFLITILLFLFTFRKYVHPKEIEKEKEEEKQTSLIQEFSPFYLINESSLQEKRYTFYKKKKQFAKDLDPSLKIYMTAQELYRTYLKGKEDISYNKTEEGNYIIKEKDFLKIYHLLFGKNSTYEWAYQEACPKIEKQESNYKINYECQKKDVPAYLSTITKVEENLEKNELYVEEEILFLEYITDKSSELYEVCKSYYPSSNCEVVRVYKDSEHKVLLVDEALLTLENYGTAPYHFIDRANKEIKIVPSKYRYTLKKEESYYLYSIERVK